VDADIRIHIDLCLRDDPKLSKWDESTKGEITMKLTSGAKGMYVSLFCLAHLSQVSVGNLSIREPSKLPETFKSTERIERTSQNFGRDLRSNPLPNSGRISSRGPSCLFHSRLLSPSSIALRTGGSSLN
jgi:hypothetical protein